MKLHVLWRWKGLYKTLCREKSKRLIGELGIDRKEKWRRIWNDDLDTVEGNILQKLWKEREREKKMKKKKEGKNVTI